MFDKIENGTVVNVQGLDCCIPPEGYVHNILTDKLEYRGVYSRSDIPEKQYWERIPLPDWYKGVLKKWDDYDKKRKEDDEDFYDEKLEELKKGEWDKRLNGMWIKNFNPQKNESESVYLTGTHYYFLQYWTLDTGIPDFRMPDLEKAYFMQYCIEDPLCMGMVEVTKRRFGKSFWAGLFITEYITRTKMTNGGIQSKTGKDAKKFFGKTVVNPFRRLPKFFRPVYDTSLGANPKSEIRFQRTNIRGKNSDQNIADDELGSLIDHESADKVAYDGQKIHRYVADECGKTIEEDIYERHEVVRYCLLDDKGVIIGKALYTTTVEKIDSDKDGVQDAFKVLWKESDQNNRTETGMTGTGLYRFFMTAKKTRNIDKYGYPDEALTLKTILKERESVKNNPRSLSARIRKEPLTIEEAFMEDGDKCVFNIQNIIDRENQLKENPVFKRRILYRRNDTTGKVEAKDAKGDFYWAMTELLDEDQSNNHIYDQGLKKPNRTRLGAIAVDSYSNSQGGRKYGSKASGFIGIRDGNKRKAIGHLYGRPDVKEILHEQIMLAAEYWGFKVWYEHTADDYLSYFRERGRVGYLGRYPMSLIDTTKREDPDRHFGTPITPFSLTKQLDAAIAYFEDHIDWIDFESVLDNAKKFDPYKRTEFDTMVSFLMLIVCLNETMGYSQRRREPIIEVYENKGTTAYN